jgi:hypothetical protein
MQICRAGRGNKLALWQARGPLLQNYAADRINITAAFAAQQQRTYGSDLPGQAAFLVAAPAACR